MAFHGPIEDRLAIRELYGAFGDASSRANANDWLACWTDDGQWLTPFFDCRGKENLKSQWDTLWLNFAQVTFIGDVGAIEVEGDQASGRSVAREIIRLANGNLYKLVGRYEDQLIKENGQWRFSRRHYLPMAEE